MEFGIGRESLQGLRQQRNVLHLEIERTARVSMMIFVYHSTCSLIYGFDTQYQLAMSSLRMTLLLLKQSEEEPERIDVLSVR
jgi:hypothetical protein